MRTDGSGAVFLSYASQDSVAANRLCEALRASGIEVWFDQSELRGGDAWDQQIRRRIRDCRLFVALVSATTQSRPEGYFRREWRLATDRTHDLADDVPFLLPVVIDETSEGLARVPDKFRDVQWTRLTDDAALAAFVDRIQSLLAYELPASVAEAPTGSSPRLTRPVGTAPDSAGGTRRRGLWMIGMTCVVALPLVYLSVQRLRAPPSAPERQVPARAEPTADSSPPAASDLPSIAVLPFLDMSEKHDQEYFSDGMAEEVIDLLVKIPGLRVPARSSSFYFKGKTAKIQEIAHELGVANVLEGTVRKQGNHLRVTAQLVQAQSGFSLWSETYDRQLRDVFKTQDEIAAAVVKALKVSLLNPQVSSAGPTSNSEAYQLYLQARALASTVATDNMARAYAYLKKAVALDPGFALAWAGIAEIVSNDSWNLTAVYGAPNTPFRMDGWLKIWAAARAEARIAADRAVQLAPDSAEAHFAKATVLHELDWDWPAAEAELARARALAPDDTRMMLYAAELAVQIGKIPEGIALAKRSELLDPLGKARKLIALASAAAGDLDTAEASARRVVELYPTEEDAYFNLGCILLLRGRTQDALDVYRRSSATAPFLTVAPPLALDALGRRQEAEQAMAKAEALFGTDMAYQIAYFYARRGDQAQALQWLERARLQHDGGLTRVKIDPMLSNLHGTPGFEDLLRRLHLPP